MQHVIQATVLTGCAKGEDVFIPRIPIIPSDNTIQFKRIQFPLKLCFVMTINKSQGQSLGIAGIDLQTPCFSHGQFRPRRCSKIDDCAFVSSDFRAYLELDEKITKNEMPSAQIRAIAYESVEKTSQ
ncbi:ATP-dependent DNA helicase [Trichonephila clavipes]|nr:ATP-dependent DNA helicase [Trichonephila clavipes]